MARHDGTEAAHTHPCSWDARLLRLAGAAHGHFRAKFGNLFLCARRPSARGVKAHGRMRTHARHALGKVAGMSGVQMGPGATALTRMCRRRHSSHCDKEYVNDTMAPLVAL